MSYQLRIRYRMNEGIYTKKQRCEEIERVLELNGEYDLSIRYAKLGKKLFKDSPYDKLPYELKRQREFVFDILKLLDQNIHSKNGKTFIFDFPEFLKQIQSAHNA